MEYDNPIIGFELMYGGAPVFCEVVMYENHYKTYFNGKFMAEIEMNDDFDWQIVTGTIIPEDIIEDIGAHIEGRLD